MKIKRQFEINYTPSPGEFNNSLSKTIPDQTITMRQLLINHTRGIPSPHTSMRQPQFFDTDIPHIQDMNDLQELRDNVTTRTEQIKDNINEINTFRKQQKDSKDKNQTSTRDNQNDNEK